MLRWREPRYRLMVLTRGGLLACKAEGTKKYLRTIAAKCRASRGRQWIELNYKPAVAASVSRRDRGPARPLMILDEHPHRVVGGGTRAGAMSDDQLIVPA